MTRFSDEEVRRYSRQIVLPEVGGVGQQRLRAAAATAASEVEALYLAAAGVGRLIVPSERIAAAARALNPLVTVEVRAADARAGAVGAALACAGEGAAAIAVDEAALAAWRRLKEMLAL